MKLFPGKEIGSEFSDESIVGMRRTRGYNWDTIHRTRITYPRINITNGVRFECFGVFQARLDTGATL